MDVLVDHPAGDVRLDHGLPDCLKLKGRELAGLVSPEQATNETHGGSDAGLLVGRLAVLHIVGLGVIPEGEDQLIDR